MVIFLYLARSYHNQQNQSHHVYLSDPECRRCRRQYRRRPARGAIPPLPDQTTAIQNLYNLHVFTRQDFLRDFARQHQANGEQAVTEALRAQLRERTGKQLADLPNVSYAVAVGSVTREIVHFAQEKQADLIIVGKTEEGQGTHAKKLSRHVQVNTLVVPPGATEELTHILVPVDFSEHSGKVLQTAIALAQSCEETPRISCLHVYEMPDLSSYDLSMTPEKFHEYIEKSIAERFDEFLDQYAGEADMDIESVLTEEMRPSVARYILNYAGENEVDFIVIGNKGHSGLDAIFLGSTAERVIARNKEAALLLVK